MTDEVPSNVFCRLRSPLTSSFLAKILRLERRQPTGGNLLQLTRVTVEVNDTADVRCVWLADFAWPRCLLAFDVCVWS